MPESRTVTSMTTLILLAGLACPSLAQTPTTTPNPPSEPTPAPSTGTDSKKNPAGDWLNANAIVFKTPEAGNGFDDLAGLDSIVGDARVVSLGEPTHGTREAFQMKHRLFEYLVEKKGFNIFSIEANMPESYALNEYVIDGKGDPKKLIAGMYFWTWRTQEVLMMVEWMRAWNKAHPDKAPITFTGFDMQTPDVAARIATEYFTKHAPALADLVKNACEDVVATSRHLRGGGTSDGNWGTATGTFPTDAVRGKKLRISAWAKTNDVSDYIALWTRADVDSKPGAFASTQKQAVKGTTPWTRYEIEIDVPTDAGYVGFGFILSGSGTVWFDDVEITLDGERYENKSQFSFDFENDAVQYLVGLSGNYDMKRTEQDPHGGKKCLEITRTAPVKPPIDVRAASANANAALAKAQTARGALIAKTGESEAEWAIQNLRIVAQCAAMHASENGFNSRDESMAANFLWILDQNPGKKGVIWAHNGHVSKGGYMTMKSMGGHLDNSLGKDMVVFGFATGTGTYTAASMGGSGLKRDNALISPLKKSIERVFSDAGLGNALIDIRDSKADDPATKWAATSISMRSIGALATLQQFYPCVPKNNYDVIVWQRETTASQPIDH